MRSIRQQMIGPMGYPGREADRRYEYRFTIHYSEATFMHEEGSRRYRDDRVEGWASMITLGPRWNIFKKPCERNGVRVTWERRLILTSEPMEFEPESSWSSDGALRFWLDPEARDERVLHHAELVAGRPRR